MAIYEYYCEECKLKFEQITSSTDKDAGRCPKCGKNETKKLFSVFAVGTSGSTSGESACGGCCGAASGGSSGGCPYSGGGCSGD